MIVIQKKEQPKNKKYGFIPGVQYPYSLKSDEKDIIPTVIFDEEEPQYPYSLLKGEVDLKNVIMKTNKK